MANKLLVTLTRSVIGRPEDQRESVKALGLRKLNQTVEHQDYAAIRGMINKVAHLVIGRFGAGEILLKPASEGTGVIAGGPVRAVLELAGVADILSKSLGTNTPINMVRATIDGLKQLKRAEDVAKLRGKSVEELLGYGGK